MAEAAPARRSNPLRVLMRLVQFEHTVFALPFAYTGLLLGSKGRPAPMAIVWVSVAMVAARTAAFVFNRLFDRDVDAANPRTVNRPLPSGEISVRAVWLLGLVSILVLGLAAWELNPVCLALLPLPLVLFASYPFIKRVLPLGHWILGLAIAGAPLGGWLAASGGLPLAAWWLGLAVVTWMAGLDILYAFQDFEVDRAQGLHSIPADAGPVPALVISGLMHVLTVAFLVLAGLGTPWLGWPWYLGVGVATLLLVYEHTLVTATDWSRVNRAFFTTNSYFALIVLLGALLNRAVMR